MDHGIDHEERDKDGEVLEPVRSSARITKDATGTVFMSCTGGSKIRPRWGKRYARDPVKVQEKCQKESDADPPEENAMADQKSGRTICSQSAQHIDRSHKGKYDSGSGEAAVCQRTIQNRMIESLRRNPGKTMIHGGCLLP